MQRVTGTVTYLQRIALPPSAEVKVALADVSRADAPAVVLGDQRIATEGRRVPFEFELAYDPSRQTPVLTGGAPARVEMVLKAVSAPR